MPKTVYFIRHAKSSWENPGMKDFDRPLNPRGLRDAPFMAKLLRGKGVEIDQIIASPANRAFTTASYFAEEYGIAKEDIVVDRSIYEAYPETVLGIIEALNNELNTVLLFGHNPSLTTIANQFSVEYIANVPTCGIVKVEADIKEWSAFVEGIAMQTAFYYPKQYS